MLNEINELMKMIANDEEFFKNVAMMLKKLHDELVAAGFSEDASNHICSNFKATGN